MNKFNSKQSFFYCFKGSVRRHLVIKEFPFLVTPAESVGILMREVGMAVKAVLSAVSYTLWRR